MFRSKIIPVALAGVIAVGGAGSILAATKSKEASESQEITAVMNAKTSLVQAIATAEQETGGKAISAELERHKGVMTYQVKVNNGSKLQKVLVDPETGKVTKKMAAKAGDHEDDDNDND